MSKFIGVKMVEAEPMIAHEAMDRGYRVNTNDIDEKGYEVTYPDGYKSWCPADVFEASYFGLNPKNDGSKIFREDVEEFIGNVDVMTVGDKTTVVNAHTITGFNMVKHSSCVDPKNYSQELGKEYALEEVTNDLWAHLGFVLQWAKCGLKRQEVLPPHVQRMIDEHRELEQKISKLGVFIANSPNFKNLEVEEQERMKKQHIAMDEYFHILDERIAKAFENLGINK